MRYDMNYISIDENRIKLSNISINIQEYTLSPSLEDENNTLYHQGHQDRSAVTQALEDMYMKL
jgi:hypothetical protein